MEESGAALMAQLPATIQWCGKDWKIVPEMPEIWAGHPEKLPIELVFGNYLLRSPHAMLWVHLADEKRGEPFDIWEIRILAMNPDQKKKVRDVETLGEDDWENVMVENSAPVSVMTQFLKRCIFEDKMAVYIQPRKPWDPQLAEQYEAEQKVEDEEERL